MSTNTEELRARLATHSTRLARITLDIGAQDGGSRTTFRFLSSHGEKIEEWEDWTIPLDYVERELRELWGDVRRDGSGYAYTFYVRNRRTPPTPVTQS